MLFPTRTRATRGEDLTIEPEVGVVLDHDIAVLAAEDRVASDEHAVADEDPAIVGPLGVEADRSSMTTLSPITILCGWRTITFTPNTTLRPTPPRISGYSFERRNSPSAPGTPARQQHDELVAHERPEPALSHHQLATFSDLGTLLVE